MRSLYVEDIPGAKPKRHVYDKKVYREKHDEEILRFARNPQEKRIIDWYAPPKRPTQPLNRDDEEIWKTKRTLRKSFDSDLASMSKSTVLNRQSFMNQHNNQSNLAKSSILMSSGQSSLNNSKQKEQNPLEDGGIEQMERVERMVKLGDDDSAATVGGGGLFQEMVMINKQR